MAGDRTLKLSILADTKNLVDGLKKGENSTDSFGKKIADVGKKAALALAAAGAAAIAFASKAVLMGEQADTANKRIEQINKSMGLFGESTKEVTDRLVEYAEATARATGVDTNSIKATQAKLLTFKELAKSANEIGGEFDRATKAAIDLAAAGFGSAETNAVQLGKALQDPIKGLTALSRSGVTFTEVEKDRIKTLVESNKIGEAQRLILEAIETQVGGTAEATANASDKIRIGFTQVQERIGIALLPAFEKLTNFILDRLFPAFEQKVLPVFKNVNDFLQNNLVPFMQKYFVPIIDAVRDAFEKVSTAVSNNKGNFEAVFVLFQTVFEFAQKYLVPILKTQLKLAIEGIGTAFKILFDVASPIIGAIAKLVTGIINIIDKAIQGVVSLANKAIDAINAVLSAYNRIPILPDVGLIPKIGQTKTSTGSNAISTQIPTITLPTTLGGTSKGTTTLPSGTTTTTTTKIAAAPTLVGSGQPIPSTFDVAAAKIGENAGITINVNAPSVIDETGFTRAVQLAIQQTQQRGTGGSGFAQIL